MLNLNPTAMFELIPDLFRSTTDHIGKFFVPMLTHAEWLALVFACPWVLGLLTIILFKT